MTTHLRQVWDRGETALGAFLFFREPLIAEAAALAGYDYVCVDMQHGLQSFEHTVTMLYAMARTETTPIVRVPWNEPSIIGRVLDAGAYGVIVPMVNTVEEARAAVAACRYAPVGSRSMGPVGVSARAGREGYFSTANDKVLCIPMIETKQAVENVDEIAAVPGDRRAVHRSGRPVDHLWTGAQARPGRRGVEPGDRAGQGRLRTPRGHPGHPCRGRAGREAPIGRVADDHRRLRPRQRDEWLAWPVERGTRPVTAGRFILV